MAKFSALVWFQPKPISIPTSHLLQAVNHILSKCWQGMQWFGQFITTMTNLRAGTSGLADPTGWSAFFLTAAFLKNAVGRALVDWRGMSCFGAWSGDRLNTAFG